MKFSAYPLLPFSLLYAGITCTRNWLYDHNIIASESFSVPVINVGNLTVGGTGKTPHVEFLVRLLYSKNIAILSRGYKRQTKGFVLADANASASTIGDEPYQYAKAFPEVTVVVCEDRVAGIHQLLRLKPETEVVLLDDAFQHRPVKAHLNILITDYHRLFYQDYVLPAGRLREGRAGAQRADIIIVSKTPEIITGEERAAIRQHIQAYTRPDVPVFFTYYRYLPPVSFGRPAPLSRHIIVVTGIAHTGPLLRYLQDNNFTLLKHFCFPDHHVYTQQDMIEISNFAISQSGGKVSILTTQKDWTKLSSLALAPTINSMNIFYIPIQVQFLKDLEHFEQIILSTAVKA